MIKITNLNDYIVYFHKEDVYRFYESEYMTQNFATPKPCTDIMMKDNSIVSAKESIEEVYNKIEEN